MQKRGQVTVFIILGIIMLSATMFLFFIIADMQKQELIAAEEDVVQKSFQREGMRLYIEDCLIDSLEEGLILIGKQGRLWEGQEGGKIAFQEGYNGLTVGLGESNMLYYGINYEKEIVYPESYPCKTEKEDSPDFCSYSYPDKGAFGSKEKLSLNAIESDLLGHLKSKTISCVGEFLESNLSISKDLLEGDPIINLNFESEGISVRVEYPIELTVLDETLFHLTEFNFFYTSSIRSFISSAVTGPIKKEYEDVSYTYKKDDLEHSEIYKQLSPTFEKFNLSDGDTVYRFHLDDGVILKEQDYLFQFAIKNRPPALDYIERYSCDYYDYLIIPSYTNYMTQLNITAKALDPEGHNITYSCTTDLEIFTDGDCGTDQNNLSFSHDYQGETPTPGTYNITINTTDEFGLYDLQNIRVKLEEPVEVGVEVKTPYGDIGLEDGKVVVSIEDPVFVTVNFPSAASTTLSSEVLLEYFDNEYFIFNASPANTGDPNKCISLPKKEENDIYRNCIVDDYKNDIRLWNETLLSDDALYPYFKNITDHGRLELKFEAEYCGSFSGQSQGDSVDIKVKQCLPHKNESYPWPYPFHDEHYNIGSDGNVNLSDQIFPNDGDANPFMSTHACCTQSGTYEPSTTICYQKQPSCKGEFFVPLNNWSDGSPGYVLEGGAKYCSGKRGNVCGDGSPTVQTSLHNSKLICGSPEYDRCDPGLINEQCYNELAWGIVWEFTDGIQKKHWCHGEMGCGEVCKEEDGAIVFLGGFTPNNMPLNNPPIDNKDRINQLAFENHANNDNTAPLNPNFKFACGCSAPNVFDDDHCDSDYDGVFEGRCLSGECSALVSP